MKIRSLLTGDEVVQFRNEPAVRTPEIHVSIFLVMLNID
jgi:hypothetical protein